MKRKGLYRNFYQHDDHVAIEKLLNKMKNVNWLVSYDNVSEIKEIYRKYQYQEYFLRYSAQIKYRGSEVMIYGPRLKYPENVSPFYAVDTA